MGSSLQVMSPYECDERGSLQEENETDLRSRTTVLSKYIHGGDAFHKYTKRALEMKYAIIEATCDDEAFYN
jgi:hypothetical protein